MALILLAALQSDPRIEKVERLAGNVNRPLLWCPLKVTVSSAAGFKGDLVARSSFGFSTAREIAVAAGGRKAFLLEALDPAEIVAGPSSFRMPRDFVRVDRVVVVDARLAYAAELVTSERTSFATVEAEDLAQLLPRGLLEAADLILLAEPSPIGAAPAAVVAPMRADADRALAQARPAPPVVELVDRVVWPLAPSEGWVPAKKTMTLFFAVLYGFAAFVALAVGVRRFAKHAAAIVAGLALLGAGGYLVLFPRDHLWVTERAVEVVPPAGDAAEWRVWFASAAAELTARIEFPRLVKPVFPTSAGAAEPFTIRVLGGGCAAEGLRVGPGRSFCFAGVAGIPAMLDRPLRDAILVRGGRAKRLGDLPANAAVPRTIEKDEPILSGAEFAAWRRFLGSDGLCGFLEGEGRRAEDVRSPDMADARRLPRFFIRRLP